MLDILAKGNEVIEMLKQPVPDFKKTFGDRLRVRMAELNMKPVDLAAASGVYVDTVRNYMNGKAAPLFETAFKLAIALDCTPNDLCDLKKG